MFNNIFPLIVQAGVQPVTENVIVVPFESAATWIDDVIAMYLIGY